MAPRAVACEGDVAAVVGATPLTPAKSGTWTADPVRHGRYEHVRVGGTPVVVEARCVFRFSGADADGKAVVGDEEVVLTAGATVWMGSAEGVLAHGDAAASPHGNRLEVVSARPARTG